MNSNPNSHTPPSRPGGALIGGSPSRTPSSHPGTGVPAGDEGVLGGTDSSRGGPSATADGSSGGTVHHSEDRLSRAWRGIASAVVVAAVKAEKVASVASSATTGQAIPDAKQQQQTALKELDESVVAMLRNRVDYIRLISYLEAKLQGREEEMATLQHYHSSHAKLGIRTKHDAQNGTASRPTMEG
jgi:hypothetical protein